MKVFTAHFLVIVLFFISSCQNRVALSQQYNSQIKNSNSENLNDKTSEQIPDKNDEDELTIEKIVSEKEFLDYNGYQISQFITQKTDDEGSPTADIADAVLKKNGKQIIKFDGVYYPLGNQMQFGLFSLLKNKNEELLVYDNSIRFGRFWVVNFDNDAKLIFDSGDWGGFREWINFFDLENDGIYEFSMAQNNWLGFQSLASIDTPLMSIIFKYDKKTNKYLPANHKYRERTKSIVEEQSEENASDKNLEFRNVMENFLKYIYAGMETEAWSYFEKNYNFDEYSSGVVVNNNSNFNGARNLTLTPQESKKIAKERIINSLKEDKIYNFIKSEIGKNN